VLVLDEEGLGTIGGFVIEAVVELEGTADVDELKLVEGVLVDVGSVSSVLEVPVGILVEVAESVSEGGLCGVVG